MTTSASSAAGTGLPKETLASAIAASEAAIASDPDAEALDTENDAAAARGYAEAFLLVGHDLQRGLVEARKIRARNAVLYDAERRAGSDTEEHSAVKAADEGSRAYHYMLRHLWKKVPITSFDDVGWKASLAAEHGDYFDDDDDDENMRVDICRQIAAFFERTQARKWIDGARAAGLSVLPWHGSINDTSNRVVATFGQEIHGPNSYSSASDRFHATPESRAIDGLRIGIVFEALCEEFEADPADPAMCAQVNAKVRAADMARAALGATLQQLGRDLDALHTEREEFLARNPDVDDDSLYDRHWELRAAINEIPAATFDDLQVKARAASYALRYDETAECDVSGSFNFLARSLAADVLRIGGTLTDIAPTLLTAEPRA